MSAVDAFVQNEAGSTTKNRHDESSFKHLGSIELIEPYPYAYGFIPGTAAPDGDCLGCYFVTDSVLHSGDLIKAVPVGVLEFFENGQPDHKVLCVPAGEQQGVSSEQVEALKSFVRSASKQFPDAGFELGQVLGETEARLLVKTSSH